MQPWSRLPQRLNHPTNSINHLASSPFLKMSSLGTSSTAAAPLSSHVKTTVNATQNHPFQSSSSVAPQHIQPAPPLQASRTVSTPPTHLRRHSNLIELITPSPRPRSSLAPPPPKLHAPKPIPRRRCPRRQRPSSPLSSMASFVAHGRHLFRKPCLPLP